MITDRFPRRVLSAAVAAAVALAPSLPAYAGTVEVFRVEGLSSPQGPRALAVPLAGVSGPMLALPSLAAPSLSFGFAPTAAPTPVAAALASPAAAIAAHAAPALALAAPAPVVAEAVSAAPASVLTAAAPAGTAREEAPLRAVSRQVSTALESAGNLAAAAPGGLRGLGQRLEAALTGAPALSGSGELTAAPSSPMDEFPSRQLARPAGDSIRQAVEAVEVPSAPSAAPAAKPSVKGPQGPFWPKLLASGLALVPAWFLGVPLLTGGALALGGLTVAGGVALAAMPFLESAPKVLRALPGAVVGALGVTAVVSGFIAPGLFAAVGGWGLMRYGLGKSSVPRYESMTSLSAYFGGVAALTGAALAAAGPAGWLAAAAGYAAYPVSALLWLHLPSWVGEGVASSFEGAWLGVKGLSRVMTAVHRDTTLLDRLQSFSERQWRASKWNAVWLSLIWTPIVLVELAKRVLAGIAGLYTGAIQAPVMFLWGASYKLFGPGKAAAYFAEAARFVFDHVQNGKAALFNPLEAKVLPLADSDSLGARAVGSLALTALQAGWLVYTAVATPLLTLGGLLLAFGKMGTFDASRHAPSSLRVNTSDSPGAKPSEPAQPQEPTTPAKAPFAPKLIAAALALMPAVYFGLPLLTGTLFLHGVGILYALTTLPLAAMPFMGPKTPRFFKSLAGHGLVFNGLLLLLGGQAAIAGLLAALGGWGFTRYAKERDGKDARFDDASELGAFFGALGSAVGIGAAWAGLAGPWGWAALGLAAVTSPFLLMHLPQWTFAGALGAFRELPRSMSAYAQTLGFWHDDTKFISHLRDHANYWLKKTYWNGVWLSLIWVPTGLLAAAEYLVSIALGLVTGLVRAPFGFVAGAAKNAKPDGRPAKFFGAALDGWRGAAEDSKPLFDRMISGLKPAMDESSPVTGRPTVKAMLAFLGARFVQLGWLVGVLLMNVSGAALAVGLYRGAKAAFGAKPVEKN